MTDKEMIINGVDVSECEYHFKQFDNWIGKDVVMCDCTLGCRCEPKENHCKFYMYYLEQQLDQLKQTLTEIKEIAENMNNECFYDDFECKDCDMKNGCTYFNKKQILQKISEVENDR